MNRQNRRVRVSELAVELGLTNLETVELCLSQDVYVLDANSLIEIPEVNRIRRAILNNESIFDCPNCESKRISKLILHPSSWRRVRRLVCEECNYGYF